MSAAGRALKRPADFDSGDKDSDIVDVCSSSSSGDEAVGVAGSAAADGDATLSEDSDADDEAGAAARCLAGKILYGCIKLIFFAESAVPLAPQPPSTASRLEPERVVVDGVRLYACPRCPHRSKTMQHYRYHERAHR